MTSSSPSPSKRAYAQLCPLARALDAVGERWTLLVIRNLLVGPQRYSELLDTLPGITTNLLAKRLKELRERGLLTSRERHGVSLYALTPRGRELEGAVWALANWGQAEPIAEDARRCFRWSLVGLRRRYRGKLNCRVRLETTEKERSYLLLLTGESLEFTEDFEEGPDLILSAREEALFSLLQGSKTARELMDSNALRLTGSRGLLAKFLKSVAPHSGGTVTASAPPG